MRNSASLPDTSLQNVCDLDFNLSRSHKVKFNGGDGLLIYGFTIIMVFNSNIWSNWASFELQSGFKYLTHCLTRVPLKDANSNNLGDPEFYLSRSLKVSYFVVDSY